VLDALPSRGELLSALAASAGSGVAVGDGGGVSWWRDGRWSRAQTPAVRDLAFDPVGRLWIATLEGLFVWAPDARPQRRTLRDGDASGRVSRIESKGRALVAATDGGAYRSVAGGAWQTLNTGSADQPVFWVAMRQAGVAGSQPRRSGASAQLAEVWTFGAEGLVRTRGIEAASGLRIVDRIIWPLPRPLAESGAVDLVIDPDEERLHLVYPDAIAVLELAGSDPRAVRWRWVRPVLPPGAVIRRLIFGTAGQVWLATDHGLHVAVAVADADTHADAVSGRYVRVANPAGSRECTDVVEGGVLPAEARAIALCRTTLLALIDPPSAGVSHASPDERRGEALDPAPRDGPAGGERPGAAPASIELPADPPVAAIRDRALARVGLAVERADSLWRGLRRKALLPSIQLRGEYDSDRDRSRSRNQSFVSGDTRNLRDLDRDLGRHHGAVFVLDWELGGLAYADESVELYRELRQVTSLRDDVSDEIHQLYFERQRIRGRIAVPESLAPGEQAELLLRAEELDAGLDAWTGGWISDWRAGRDGRLGRDGADARIHPVRIERSID
jgi:hypothetical protein